MGWLFRLSKNLKYKKHRHCQGEARPAARIAGFRKNAPSGFGWGVGDNQVFSSMHAWMRALTMAAISVVFMPAYSS